jgi:hypothetical protein
MSDILNIETSERRPDPWRGVFGAWLTALVIMAAFVGFHSLVSWRTSPPGVVIPQHDQTRGDGQFRGDQDVSPTPPGFVPL